MESASRLRPQFPEQLAGDDGRHSQTALRKALNSGDRHELRRVSRLYPYTPSGVEAAQILIADAIQSGRREYAGLLLKSFDEAYEKFPAGRGSAVASVLSENSSIAPDSARPVLTPVQLATDAQRSPTETSAAWPTPVWEWKEDLAGLAADQLPDLPTTMQIMESSSARDRAAFVNWPPAVSSELVLFPQPFRIVAINRVTGDVKWELPTDTFHPVLRELSDNSRRP